MAGGDGAVDTAASWSKTARDWAGAHILALTFGERMGYTIAPQTFSEFKTWLAQRFLIDERAWTAVAVNARFNGSAGAGKGRKAGTLGVADAGVGGVTMYPASQVAGNLPTGNLPTGNLPTGTSSDNKSGDTFSSVSPALAFFSRTGAGRVVGHTGSPYTPYGCVRAWVVVAAFPDPMEFVDAAAVLSSLIQPLKGDFYASANAAAYAGKAIAKKVYKQGDYPTILDDIGAAVDIANAAYTRT